MAKVSHSNPELDNVLGQHTPTGDWMIRVSGYGTFEFKGTENAAETMRSHKANLERGSSMKWRIGAWAKPSDKIAAKVADLFDAGKGAPGVLMQALFKARKKEQEQENG